MTNLYIESIRLDEKLDKSMYISKLPAVDGLYKNGLSFKAPVTFFTGENGTGKSTLIEAIAVASGFNAEGGSRNFNFSTRKSHSPLCDLITLIRGPKRPRDGWFLRAESFYNAATQIEKLDEIPAVAPPISASYGGQSLHTLSHGESFLTLVLKRFSGNGLYILDEPESALSPSRQLALLVRIKELCDTNSQFIIATHSPILLAYPDAEIYEFDDRGINLTDYRNTSSYTLTKRFLSDPKTMLEKLFNQDQ